MPKAKYSKKRNGKGFVAVRVNSTLTLGTLASNVAVVQALDGSVAVDKMFAVSADILWGSLNATPGEGPIVVGLAHDDYSVTEIKEALEASNMDQSDKVAQEQARRLVRDAGIFPYILSEETLNQGRHIRTRLKFYVENGHGINAFAINRSGSTLTTGSFIKAEGKLFMRRI